MHAHTRHRVSQSMNSELENERKFEKSNERAQQHQHQQQQQYTVTMTSDEYMSSELNHSTAVTHSEQTKLPNCHWFYESRICCCSGRSHTCISRNTHIDRRYTLNAHKDEQTSWNECVASTARTTAYTDTLTHIHSLLETLSCTFGALRRPSNGNIFTFHASIFSSITFFLFISLNCLCRFQVNRQVSLWQSITRDNLRK